MPASLTHDRPELAALCVRLCDETQPLEQAIAEARNQMRTDPLFDVLLAKQIPALQSLPNPLDGPRAVRALEILDAISPGNRLVVTLAALMQSPAGKVRSKAALLLGRRVQTIEWQQLRCRESDPRVRANIIEALWGSAAPAAIEIFHQALEDTEPRIIANAALGIYKSDAPEGAAILRRLTNHDDPRVQRSALWALGQTHDAQFLPLLRTRLQDSDPLTRSLAMRGLIELRRARAAEPGCAAVDQDLLTVA